jgi:hypothetical protein
MADAGVRLTGPRVVTLAYDGLCTFEVGVAVEVFALPRPEMGRDWYRHAISGIEPGPLRAAGGLTVTVDGGLSLLSGASSFLAGDRSMHRYPRRSSPRCGMRMPRGRVWFRSVRVCELLLRPACSMAAVRRHTGATSIRSGPCTLQ